jgi:hypothetical protein
VVAVGDLRGGEIAIWSVSQVSGVPVPAGAA